MKMNKNYKPYVISFVKKYNRGYKIAEDDVDYDYVANGKKIDTVCCYEGELHYFSNKVEVFPDEEIKYKITDDFFESIKQLAMMDSMTPEKYEEYEKTKAELRKSDRFGNICMAALIITFIMNCFNVYLFYYY